MLPGPNYVYKCPNCGNFLTNRSLLSGNTFGARRYSDGKVIAPMFPAIPDLTKCKKCNTIFWLSRLKEIGTYDCGKKQKSAWPDADDAGFLGIDDYFRAIDSGIAENKDMELFIRRSIWWTYNDRHRDGKKMFVDENDEKGWKENCEKLISLLDQSELDLRIMTAELKRNLGDFKGCLDIITSIDDENYYWLKTKFINECEQINRWVICF